MSIQTTKPRAGVIGAGVAGLSAAVSLSRAGWVVDVYEKSRMQNETGAAITIMPFANGILDSWGFDFQKARGVPVRRLTISNAATKELIAHEEFEDLAQIYGYDASTYHRVDLHKGLLELTSSRCDMLGVEDASVHLHTGVEVSQLDCEEGTVFLSSGERVQRDLLVVADGAHTQLLPYITGHEIPTTRAGRSVLRILIPRSALETSEAAQNFLKSSPNNIPGMYAALDPVENVLMFTYLCREGDYLNIALVHDTQASIADTSQADVSWQTPASMSDTLRVAKNFCEDFKSILMLAPDENIVIHHCMQRSPLDSFIRGKAVLLGDSAELMLPTHAAGGSIAIESAAVLGILMRDVGKTHSSFPPTPELKPQKPVNSPAVTGKQHISRPPCSTSSSTRDLIVGMKASQQIQELDKIHNNSESGSITSPEEEIRLASPDRARPNDSATQPSLRASLVSRSLNVFDSLRQPRCVAMQLLSNGGFLSQGRPEVIEQIRRHGYDGPLPGPTAIPWSPEYRKFYFECDAVAGAEKALANFSPHEA